VQINNAAWWMAGNMMPGERRYRGMKGGGGTVMGSSPKLMRSMEITYLLTLTPPTPPPPGSSRRPGLPSELEMTGCRPARITTGPSQLGRHLGRTEGRPRAQRGNRKHEGHDASAVTRLVWLMLDIMHETVWVVRDLQLYITCAQSGSAPRH